MNSRLLIIAALMVTAASCQSAPAPSETATSLDRLTELMTGSFASTAQAAADPEYHDIRLHMARIWPEREDGYWLYVEQAVASAQDRPYRQRVYRVAHVGDDLYESRVYELPDPDAAIGVWQDPEPLPDLTPEALVIREGASIYLRDVGDHFEGSTLGRMCKSDFRGASYATSEVTIEAARIVSWDRGFDDAGEHVWGAVKGGYVFDRTD